MAKLTINIDPQTHGILKEKARLDERSLTQYIGRILRQHAGTLTITDIANHNDNYNSNDFTKEEDDIWS